MSQAGPEAAGDDDPSCGAPCEPARLRALAHVSPAVEPGPDADADPDMNFFAAWVGRALGVPVALVSLVRADQQVLSAVTGRPGPRAGGRSAPVCHTFCQHVVSTAEPLVVADARQHPLVRDDPALPDPALPDPAVPDPAVLAYAGMPLTDAAGTVLGSLCAADTVPREWTADHLDTLHDIARACSTALRLRLARYDAGQEGDRRDELEEAQRRAHGRSETLLLASQAFTATRTIADVRGRIGELFTTGLRPTYVGVVLLDEEGRLRRVDTGPRRPGHAAAPQFLTADATLPAATAFRERRTVAHLDRHSFDGDHPPAARAVLRELGLHTVVAAPLPGADEPVGAVVLGWPFPAAVEPADLLTITTIAGYAGQALVRARLLDHRISVAHELQNAMLTTLPTVVGLVMAARYEPADTREYVGGDWYDAAPVHDPGHPDDQVVALSVGDVIGHDLHAATIMGQVRSMLRQSAWDHPSGPPSLVLRAFETAEQGLRLGAAGTTVVVLLCRTPGGPWSMTWTNAGHPPPVLLLPDGTTELLTDHDALFGFEFTAALPRRDARRGLEPGSTLFLYTDGLVERRDSDIDSGIDALLALLDGMRVRSPQEIVDAAVTRLAPDADDDVVAFALHVPTGPG